MPSSTGHRNAVKGISIKYCYCINIAICVGMTQKTSFLMANSVGYCNVIIGETAKKQRTQSNFFFNCDWRQHLGQIEGLFTVQAFVFSPDCRGNTFVAPPFKLRKFLKLTKFCTNLHKKIATKAGLPLKIAPTIALQNT